MFEIVDLAGDLIRLPSSNMSLEPGHIVSIKTSDDGISFALSHSRNPFGVVSEVNAKTGMVSVICGMVLFQTDNFESDQTYTKGDLLYSSNCGTFTTRKEEDGSLLLGIVSNEYLDNKDYIEISLI